MIGVQLNHIKGVKLIIRSELSFFFMLGVGWSIGIMLAGQTNGRGRLFLLMVITSATPGMSPLECVAKLSL